MESRDLVDANEGEQVTGLTKQTLYRLARKGHIRSYQVLGRSVRFERRDLLALAREKSPTTRASATPAMSAASM